jgi:membrane-associated phospholipid phosphatase
VNNVAHPVKRLARRDRPDASDFESFPSLHTARAFANAEFLRVEFKDVSPWYGIAGYTIAAATGYLRIYNNKHWLSDIVAGAGLGILSTKIAYWLYAKIGKLVFDKRSETSVLKGY